MYVPPHKRPGYTGTPTPMPTTTTIGKVLETLGWHYSAGSYYFPQNHPHIHLHINGASAYNSSTSVYANASMVAISEGGTLGGSTYVRDGSRLYLNPNGTGWSGRQRSKIKALNSSAQAMFWEVMKQFP